jgi:hypothetical protein
MEFGLFIAETLATTSHHCHIATSHPGASRHDIEQEETTPPPPNPVLAPDDGCTALPMPSKVKITAPQMRTLFRWTPIVEDYHGEIQTPLQTR